MTKQTIGDVRAALSALDFGHDYLDGDETRIIIGMLAQGIPADTIARTIAARRHAADQQSLRSQGSHRLNRKAV